MFQIVQILEMGGQDRIKDCKLTQEMVKEKGNELTMTGKYDRMFE